MIWLTEIQVIDPLTQKRITKAGPRIEAETQKEAEEKANCLKNGYCKVIGCLIMEVDAEMDWLCLN